VTAGACSRLVAVPTITIESFAVLLGSDPGDGRVTA
jgi:hypothetical protein